MKIIGKIAHLRRYPVKSMMGEELNRVAVGESGLLGDRSFAFIDDKNEDKTFPWMTLRQRHDMLLYKPKYLPSGEIQVETPGGQIFGVEEERFERFLETEFGYALSLRHHPGGCFDSEPISLIGMQSVSKIAEETGFSARDFHHGRFRANIYADWKEGTPFLEDRLLGHRLKLGKDLEIKVVKRDSRCVIPTIDPETSKPSPIILKMIQTKHEGCAGVYATVEKPGEVRVGDDISTLQESLGR